MASCRDLFIPRLAAGDAPLAPPYGKCEGKSFLECYAAMDMDFGASAPAPVTLPSGRQVMVQPAKDGAVYLIDADHFGTMLDRLVVRDFCGQNGGICCCHWAGTMVTEPLVTEVDGTPVALIPTFYMDDTNPAGVVAIDIVEEGDGASLRHRWHSPAEISPEAARDSASTPAGSRCSSATACATPRWSTRAARAIRAGRPGPAGQRRRPPLPHAGLGRRHRRSRLLDGPAASTSSRPSTTSACSSARARAWTTDPATSRPGTGRGAA